jgi:hypothetical protein
MDLAGGPILYLPYKAIMPISNFTYDIDGEPHEGK